MKSLYLIPILFIGLFYSCKEAPNEKEQTTTLTAEKTSTIPAETKKTSENTLGYNIGDVATDFSLKNIDNSYVSLKDYPNAKGYIVIFTCNHCPFSVAYEDRIIALDKQFKTKGYPVIAINPNNPKSYPDDSFENMIVRAKEKGFTFPYLVDEGQKIYPQYGATKTPHVFVLENPSTNQGFSEISKCCNVF